MKVLVTGGAGFIGMNIVEQYLEDGHEVVVVDDLSTGKEENLKESVTFYKADITTPDFIDIVKKETPDVINHHAAQIDVQTSLKNPVFDAHINILGTINVLEACKEVNAAIVYASSAAVYGEPDYLGVDEKHKVDPMSYYGASKHTPEHYIKIYGDLHGIQYSILRYANVYGIGQIPKGEGGVISIFVDKIIKGEDLTIFGDGEHTRDFIYVSDIAEANLLASKHPCNDIINISTNTQVSLNDLVKTFEEVVGDSLEKKHEGERPGDIRHSYLTNDKAEQLINWKPKVSLKEGLEKTLLYYQKKAAGNI
ncbi:NAD-dependent epimerase/dehydratase family protein [Pseudalkalibacillus sp. Hm43]|uniref:NAD-dependent epimerase/dehydratase family protein n=1 Tax=Pseudalkalibacillus sp. Hm43 TaxID=3450742 RepID=UPI003F428731